jgi:hypothetical protein
MAQLYSTGPAHAYVGIIGPGGGTTAVSYLGTCEDAPRIELRPMWDPVFNDLGGKVPFDESFQGEEAFVNLDLNRYNEGVYAALAARPRPGQGTRGTMVFGDVGALALTENYVFTLLIQFPYAVKAVMAAGGMPGGYRFPATVLAGPDQLFPLGTKPRKVNLMFHAIRVFNIQDQSFVLYDHNLSGLPAIN